MGAVVADLLKELAYRQGSHVTENVRCTERLSVMHRSLHERRRPRGADFGRDHNLWVRALFCEARFSAAHQQRKDAFRKDYILEDSSPSQVPL